MTQAPTAILLLARPVEPDGRAEFEGLANALAVRWKQVVVPCPVGEADDVLFAVRAALARGVERVAAVPLLASAVELREWKAAEQFRALGRRFTGTTFHLAQPFAPADAARAVADGVRDWLAQTNTVREGAVLFLLGPAERAAARAGLARRVFEYGPGVAVDAAAGPDLAARCDRQSRLGKRHAVLAAGDLFAAGVVAQQAKAVGLPALPPFWQLESVLQLLEARWRNALKDQSLVPQVWDEVAREVHPANDLAPAEEDALLRALNEKIALLPAAAGAAAGPLLQPALPEAVAAAPEAYQSVVAEIERGVQALTGRPTVTHKAPGWVGVACETEDAAVWLLRAIIVENVMVRREAGVLFLPAAPDYRPADVRRLLGVVGRAVRCRAQATR